MYFSCCNKANSNNLKKHEVRNHCYWLEIKQSSSIFLYLKQSFEYLLFSYYICQQKEYCKRVFIWENVNKNGHDRMTEIHQNGGPTGNELKMHTIQKCLSVWSVFMVLFFNINHRNSFNTQWHVLYLTSDIERFSFFWLHMTLISCENGKQCYYSCVWHT